MTVYIPNTPLEPMDGVDFWGAYLSDYSSLSNQLDSPNFIPLCRSTCVKYAFISLCRHEVAMDCWNILMWMDSER